LFVIKEMKK